MIGRRTMSFFMIACVVMISIAPLIAYAHGPRFPTAYFTYTLRPQLPFTTYARGNIGVLRTTYATSYLVVAYRYLIGKPLDELEQKGAVRLWEERLFDYPWNDSTWLDVRRKIPGTFELAPFGLERTEKGKGYYRSYQACNEEAFSHAAEVLTDRSQQFGPESPEVREWLAGQDMVFVNCSGGKTIPPEVHGGIHPLIRADRRYQIAAAHFYAEDFDSAERMFKEIAEDASSPYRNISPYLAVRAIIRKASLKGVEGKDDLTLLARAEAELVGLLKDENRIKIHPACERLLDLVRLRLDPRKRLRDLSSELLTSSGNAFKQRLTDYLFLKDRFPEQDSSDMADWIRNLKKGDVEKAIEKWEQTRTVPWLIASLMNAPKDHQKLSDLLAEAKKIERPHPGYATVMYYSLNLMINSGKGTEARPRLDTLLIQDGSNLPRSSVNLFLSLRLKLSQNLDELLTYAKRTPADIVEEESPEIPYREQEWYEKKPTSSSYDLLLDEDSVDIFNRKLPLRLIVAAAKDPTLPGHLQREISVSGWVKAVLLNKEKVADELATRLQELIPWRKELFVPFQSKRRWEEKKFTALLVILNTPGMKPYLVSGLGRRTYWTVIDSYRDNWWCPLGKKQGDSYYAYLCPSEKDVAFPSFLNPEEKREAEEEWKALIQIGTAPNYLADQIITWAKEHPEDPRVPEALHLVVRATRYGQDDHETSSFSKTAFTLLHRRYPESPWAKKTPYWF